MQDTAKESEMSRGEAQHGVFVSLLIINIHTRPQTLVSYSKSSKYISWAMQVESQISPYGLNDTVRMIALLKDNAVPMSSFFTEIENIAFSVKYRA